MMRPLIILTLLISCTTAQDRPNILWLTCEDNNVTYLGCYGNEFANTPNIDRLASEGFRYTHCYSNGAVCSASRSSWITGMISVSTGLLNHRSRKAYPSNLKFYPQVLQDAGYFTVNSGKADYNIAQKGEMWNVNGKVNWETLKQNQPFFQVINHTNSHESRAMSTKFSYRDPQKVKIPPYHPDVKTVRDNYTAYYEAITRMDGDIGKSLKALEAAGLADNTIVIHNSDHGGPLPRGKRFMYNSGTHCPLIIRIPQKFKHLWPAEAPGATVDRLVSFCDMIPTWISLAGGSIPAHYHGRVFLGPQTQPEADYHFSFRGRNDARIENARALRSKQYLYVKNYIPYVPRGQYLDYQWKIPAQRAWEQEYQAGRTNADQSRFFELKAEHELYDVEKDPYCLTNLAESPEHQATVDQLKSALQAEQRTLVDAAFLPESELDRIAAENQTTLFHVLRDPALYPIKLYQQTADLALMNDAANLDQLITYLSDDDFGIRYWGSVGLLMLGNQAIAAQDALSERLNDESHTVRLMAAWALLKQNHQTEAAYACIEDMLLNKSYAELEVINVIEWLGPELRQPLMNAVQSFSGSKPDTKQLRNFLINGPGELGKKKTKKKK